MLIKRILITVTKPSPAEKVAPKVTDEESIISINLISSDYMAKAISLYNSTNQSVGEGSPLPLGVSWIIHRCDGSPEGELPEGQEKPLWSVPAGEGKARTV